MKKFLIASVCVASLASSSYAELFFGVGPNLSISNENVTSNLHEILQIGAEKQTKFNYSLDFNFGYILWKTHRFYGSLGLSKSLDSYLGLFANAVIGYDFTPQIYDSWRADLGIFYGKKLTSFNYDSGFGFSKTEALKGDVYGAKIGVLREISKRSDFGIGIKYERNNLSSDFNNDFGIIKATINNFGLYFETIYKF